MDPALKEVREKLASMTGSSPDQIHPQNPVHHPDFKSVGATPGADEHANATIDNPMEALGEGLKAVGSYGEDAGALVGGASTNYEDKLGNKSLIQSLKERWQKQFPGKQLKERI